MKRGDLLHVLDSKHKFFKRAGRLQSVNAGWATLRFERDNNLDAADAAPVYSFPAAMVGHPDALGTVMLKLEEAERVRQARIASERVKPGAALAATVDEGFINKYFNDNPLPDAWRCLVAQLKMNGLMLDPNSMRWVRSNAGRTAQEKVKAYVEAQAMAQGVTLDKIAVTPGLREALEEADRDA